MVSVGLSGFKPVDISWSKHFTGCEAQCFQADYDCLTERLGSDTSSLKESLIQHLKKDRALLISFKGQLSYIHPDLNSTRHGYMSKIEEFLSSISNHSTNNSPIQILMLDKLDPITFYSIETTTVDSFQLNVYSSTLIEKPENHLASFEIYYNPHYFPAPKIIKRDLQGIANEELIRALSDETISDVFMTSIQNHPHDKPFVFHALADGNFNTTQEFNFYQKAPETLQKYDANLERFILNEKGSLLLEGRAVGHKIASGPITIINNIDFAENINNGDIVVTHFTDELWDNDLKKAAAVITNKGGRTCHTAIFCREHGIPAVVGTGNATEKLSGISSVTVTCAEGDVGQVYEQSLDYSKEENTTNSLPDMGTHLMMNVGNPEKAFHLRDIPCHGVGLARLEYIINRLIGIHPSLLFNLEALTSTQKKTISRKTAGYESPQQFYQQKIIEGISSIAAAFYPKTVIVRTSDFKSSEYAHLIGGEQFEPKENNAILGYRGATRYISKEFSKCFELECKAINHVISSLGFDNIHVLVPFCRTIGEAKQVTEKMSSFGLCSSETLKIIMMCEVPSNAILAHDFLKYFDGFSIGTTDLTQLTLGIDKESYLVSHLFDEENDAVKSLMQQAINACKSESKIIGACGEGLSDNVNLCKWLVDQKIDFISLDPDNLVQSWLKLGQSFK